MHEAKDSITKEGLSVLQQSGDSSVYMGQASLKIQLPGHEVQSITFPNSNNFCSGSESVLA